MDWIPIIITFATAAFLIPIINDYQRKTAVITKKRSVLEALIMEAEESNAKKKEEEARVNVELKEAEKEFAESGKECNELKKAIDSKRKKKR